MKFIMASPRLKTFYLYNDKGELDKKSKRIYSPYNLKTLGRTEQGDKYINPDYIDFSDGMFIADENRIGKVKFEQYCEVLSLYNSRGGFLNNWVGENADRNGQVFFKGDNIHTIKEEKPKPKKTETVKVETKEIQVIPKIIAETMNLNQLQDLSKTWGIDIPEAILKSGKAEIIKTKIIDLLETNGHIK